MMIMTGLLLSWEMCKVSLGDRNDMEGKIAELAAMQSKFGDLKGNSAFRNV